MESLEDRVKRHEGFRNSVYKDTLDKRTIGYGHLCVEDFWEDGKEYSEEYLTDIFKEDLKSAQDSANRLCTEFGCSDIKGEAKDIITEMVFQLGATGVSKFKNMWKNLSSLNYAGASIEMLDSRWAKQTKNRAEELADEMKKLGV